jgi:ribose transport system substrate-binding protein
MTAKNYTIGFSNLSEEHPYAVSVRESLERAVAQHTNLKLIVRDNAKSDQQALLNVQEFAAIPVDLAMIYHLGERIGPGLSVPLMKQKIPMIAIDIPFSPWAVYFGVNNEQSGSMAGAALGNWIGVNWSNQVDKILVMTESRVLDFVRKRLTFALDTLHSMVNFGSEDVLYLESGNDRTPSEQAVYTVLQRWGDIRRIAVIGFNDETALGALDAARALGRESDMVVVGQGGNLVLDEFRKPGSRFIASVAYYPEQYGPRLVDLALHMLQGERVAREHFIEHSPLTEANMQSLT